MPAAGLTKKVLARVLLGCAVVLLAGVLLHYKLPTLAYYWVQTTASADEWRSRSVWLPDSRVRIEARLHYQSAKPAHLEGLEGPGLDRLTRETELTGAETRLR